MIKSVEHETNAKKRIDTIIFNNRGVMSYDRLMVHLENKIDGDWNDEKRELNRINIFDLTDEQYYRKNYLSAMMNYGDKLLREYRYKKLMNRCNGTKV